MSLNTNVSACRRFVLLPAALLVIAIIVGSAMAHPLSNSKQPDLSGTWRLNQELSAYSTALPPEGVVNSGLTENSSWAFQKEPQSFRPSARVRELLDATATIEIFQHGHKLTMNAIGSSFVVLTRTINIDGRPSQHSFGLGDNGVSQAIWSDKRFILETMTHSGPKLTEVYELAPSGGRLYVLVKIEDEHWTQPLLIRRVYDKQSRKIGSHHASLAKKRHGL